MTLNHLKLLAFGTIFAAAALAGCNQTPGGATAPAWQAATAARAGAPGEYAILLYADNQPGHAETISRFYQETQKNTGWQGLFVVNEPSRSMLFWGRYPTIEAAQHNLHKAKAYAAPSGMSIFALAMVVPVGGADEGPPEWNLLNAGGAYTVLVAVYYDAPDKDPAKNYVGRKKFAVECCRRLRQQGYQVYYYHGPARSHVTIGSFPASSVRTEESQAGEGVVHRKVINDERILKIMKDFPELSVNDRVLGRPVVIDPAKKLGKLEYDKTVVVEIPKQDQAEPSTPSQPPPPPPANPFIPGIR